MRNDRKVAYTISKNENCEKGAWPRSRDLLYKFWDPPNISGMAEDTISNFACGFMVRNTKPKK